MPILDYTKILTELHGGSRNFRDANTVLSGDSIF